ncbi:hypothetical protein B6U96_11270 [Archaeoglobales archaeon ex4484_92]|nr:MAG: hypothetical protein B6U96_11270 [Archaeoglobales archaeon ex4484_92]
MERFPTSSELLLALTQVRDGQRMEGRWMMINDERSPKLNFTFQDPANYVDEQKINEFKMERLRKSWNGGKMKLL